MPTVYSVAFDGDRFLMVYNDNRKGWEMPGGSIDDGESIEDAAKREFLEESGYSVRVVAIRDLGHCHVCACELGEKVSNDEEMVSELFLSIPDELFFDKSEYDIVVPWARSIIEEHRNM